MHNTLKPFEVLLATRLLLVRIKDQETEMTTRDQQELCQALAQAYKVLADLVARPALAEDSRRQILNSLVTLEREMETWSTLPQPEYELDFSAAVAEFDFDDEPTHPGIT